MVSKLKIQRDQSWKHNKRNGNVHPILTTHTGGRYSKGNRWEPPHISPLFVCWVASYPLIASVLLFHEICSVESQPTAKADLALCACISALFFKAKEQEIKTSVTPTNSGSPPHNCVCLSLAGSKSGWEVVNIYVFPMAQCQENVTERSNCQPTNPKKCVVFFWRKIM